MKRAAPPYVRFALLVTCSLAFVPACGGDTHEATPDYGAPCGTSRPCPSGLSCLPTSDSVGYCTTTCDTLACPMGTACNSTFGASVCLRACANDAACHAGQQCWSGACQPACGDGNQCGGSGATCVAGRCHGPECTVTTDCPMGRVCSGGRCLTGNDGGPLMLGDGAPCTSSGDCASGFCLPADRGGVCTVRCMNGDVCFGEPFNSACGPATIGGAIGTFCLPYRMNQGNNAAACATDADCGNSTCVLGQCRDVCMTQAQCILGQHCTSVAHGGGAFMGCGYDPAPASGTEVRVLDLGTFTVASGQGTPDILFATPPGTISVTLRARQVGGDPLDMLFYRVVDSTNTNIFSLNAMAMYVDQTIRWYPYDSSSAVAMLIPNTTTDRYTYRAGRMQFSVAAYAAAPATSGSVNMHVDALEVVAAAPPTTGTLHLRIHLVGVGVTAASAPSDARMGAFVSRYRQVLSMVGITVADITYVDINAPALDIIDSASGYTSELAQLFRMSSGTNEDILNLFLVQNITAGGTGEFNTLGIAGGIPGPPRVQGSSHSGVVIAFDPGVVGPGTGGGFIAGTVAAHESGHFLGLYHTTENGRPCAAGEIPTMANHCAPFGGSDVIGDTAYGDSSNLMNFAIVGAASNDRLTPGQGFVELRNPLTQ